MFACVLQVVRRLEIVGVADGGLAGAGVQKDRHLQCSFEFTFKNRFISMPKCFHPLLALI